MHVQTWELKHGISRGMSKEKVRIGCDAGQNQPMQKSFEHIRHIKEVLQTLGPCAVVSIIGPLQPGDASAEGLRLLRLLGPGLTEFPLVSIKTTSKKRVLSHNKCIVLGEFPLGPLLKLLKQKRKQAMFQRVPCRRLGYGQCEACGMLSRQSHQLVKRFLQDPDTAINAIKILSEKECNGRHPSASGLGHLRSARRVAKAGSCD